MTISSSSQDQDDRLLFVSSAGLVANIVLFLLAFSSIYYFKNEAQWSLVSFAVIGLGVSVMPLLIAKLLPFGKQYAVIANVIVVPALLSLSFVTSPLLIVLVFALAALSGIFFVIRSVARNELKIDWSLGILVFVVVYCGLQIYGGSYLSLVPLEKLLSGSAHRDNLFHVAMASMIDRYGSVSTGLNGIVETPYHFGSHLLFAAISRCTQTSVMQSYAFGQGLIFFPLFLQMFLFAATSILKDENFRGKSKRVASISTLVFVSFLSVEQGDGHAFWDSYLRSESYMLALGFFFAFLGTFGPVICRKSTIAPSVFGRFELGYLAVLSTLGAAVIIMTKVSMALPLGVLFLFFILRGELFRRPQIYVAGVFFVGIAFLAYFYTKEANGQALVAFFPFQKYVTQHSLLWPLIQSIPCLLYVLLEFRAIKRLSSEFWVLLFLVTFDFVTIFPAMTMDIGGGSAYYFHNVFSWVGYLFLIGPLYRMVLEEWRFLRRSKAVAAAFLGIAVYLTGTAYSNFKGYFSSFLDQKRYVSLAASSPQEFRDLVYELQEMRQRPVPSAIIGLKTETKSVLASLYDPFTLPFIVPAVSETVSLGNLPEIPSLDSYGFGYYRPWPARPKDSEEWDAALRQTGFTKLVLF